MKNFSIRLDSGERGQIEKIAAENNLKTAAVFRMAVRHYLKAQRRKKK